MSRTFSVAVDAGGQFTHCAVVSADGHTYTGRALTVPDPSVGFFDAITDVAESMGMTLQELLCRTARLIHATTVGMSALAARGGPPIALLTTGGHGDTTGFGIYPGGSTPGAGPGWGPPPDGPISLVERRNVFEVQERLDVAGEVIMPLGRASVQRAARAISDRGIGSVAICFLWGHVNPSHERRARAILEEECIHHGSRPFVTCGHEVSSRSGEGERAAAAIVNAYISAPLGRYVSRLLERARVAGYEGDLHLAAADGTLIDSLTAASSPIRTLLGGPNAAAEACRRIARESGGSGVVFADLGGTCFDIGVVGDAEPPSSDHPLERPAHGRPGVRAHSTSLSGGAVAWIDESGRLRVGPNGVGAPGGPACFRRGSAPTITDADLLLGVLRPDLFLPNGDAVDHAAAEGAIESLAEPLGITAVECAAAVVELAEGIAEGLLRRATLGSEVASRDLELWAVGGAAGLHATAYAFSLGVQRLIVPMGHLAADWTAYALATAPQSVSLSVEIWEKEPFDPDLLEAVRLDLRDQASAAIGIPDGFLANAEPLTFAESVQVRTGTGQPEMTIPLPRGELDDAAAGILAAECRDACRRRYGATSAVFDCKPVISGLNLRVDRYDHIWSQRPRAVQSRVEKASPAPEGERAVFSRERGEMVPTPVFAAGRLFAGDLIKGPALVDSPRSTVALRAGQVLSVDGLRNFVITPW